MEIYFAAANGYGGFRSYFGECFSEYELDRFYILKGGPGTGKSTLMRRIAEHFETLGASVEIILCSSDTSSLDGVKVTSEHGSFAVVDGTMPHTLDCAYPGAKSELVDLALGFNKARLIEQSEGIIELSRRKTSRYKDGYRRLSLAGDIHKHIKRLAEPLFDNAKAERAISVALLGECETNERRARLLSAFGKDGYYALPSPGGVCEVGIYGKEWAVDSFLGLLARRARAEGRLKIYCPTPLDDRVTDAIFTDGKLFRRKDSGILADEFILGADKSTERELSRLYEIREEFLADAKDAFRLASEAHFSLEEIYKGSIDFSVCERQTARLIAEGEGIIMGR